MYPQRLSGTYEIVYDPAPPPTGAAGLLTEIRCPPPALLSITTRGLRFLTRITLIAWGFLRSPILSFKWLAHPGQSWLRRRTRSVVCRFALHRRRRRGAASAPRGLAAPACCGVQEMLELNVDEDGGDGGGGKDGDGRKDGEDVCLLDMSDGTGAHIWNASGIAVLPAEPYGARRPQGSCWGWYPGG